MRIPILELSSISCYLEKGSNIFSDISFTLNEGDILVLQGRSGSGKSTLLKCIAHLVMHSGEILYRGSSPQVHGIPMFRSHVMYVPQRPSLLPGAPYDFLEAITNTKAHKTLFQDNAEGSTKEVIKRAFDIGEAWGIEPDLWGRNWINLSGGEGQRILLAAALALSRAEVLLLDEPTSALDSETSKMVEEFLVNAIRSSNSAVKAIIWITHSSEQSRRVGTRFVFLSAGTCYEGEDSSPSPSPTPAA